MSEDDDSQVPTTKLTATKQRWAQEHKFLTGRTTRPEAERLPPGQHLVRDWPVLDLGLQPDVPTPRWTLDVDGLVAHPIHLAWTDFLALPQSREVSDIHCVTTWSRYDNQWDGVRTQDLLERVAPLPEARFVSLESFDGYTTNLPLADFAAPDALIAHAWEGAPLTRAHGGPARLVVPHLYFWKSAKWLKRITFLAEDALGFWEVRGYHERGDPWAEQRYSDD
ncbi:sulfite oxidase-like oxidoreductase [Aquabacter cavernae]|uniref:sulfite oxidase-like oxidoreductase n=1 Tax=Aquabacter cavernae TaxID=2496029 RepID=UPI000F8F552A|nr:sulfite oxidase-like oxidoreductase [Aquabacter cavernae]